MTHISVYKLNIIGSDNGLSPGRHQAIIWINAWILLIWLLGANLNGMLTEIHSFSFETMSLKCRLRHTNNISTQQENFSPYIRGAHEHELQCNGMHAYQ